MLGRGFVQKYLNLSREKESFLCVGIDPATGSMRNRNIVPSPLIELYGLSEGIKQFCIQIIDAVAPYTPVIKPNAQFITYLFDLDDFKEVVEVIHAGECLALLDVKLTDIGSTNRAGLHWISEAGFDAVTFSPFPGFSNGSDSIYQWAGEEDKGIFALCRMSNPGTHEYQSLEIDSVPLYKILARDAFKHGSNGFVVGCTATSELSEVRSIIGEERLILSPGLGPQQGDPSLAFKLGSNKEGEGLIISSSRSINFAYEDMGWNWKRYAEAAAVQAKRKRDELNILKKDKLDKTG